MATYAIGDVQGCMTTLERLLARIQYDRRQDRLWLAGDLVNRGPRSLEVLRWAVGEGDRVVSVLGNHDLHLLLRAAGLRPRKARDTLEAVLAAPDRDDLLAWVRRLPLVHRESPFFMVHGGLWPTWTCDDAERLSREAGALLAARDDAFLAALAGGGEGKPGEGKTGVGKTGEGKTGGREVVWDDALVGPERARVATVLMTTLRMLGADGRPVRYSGPLGAEAPAGAVPWYEAPGRRSQDATMLFGHWAAHGLVLRPPRFIALDSGCVWGRALSAVRLDDLAVFQEPAADGASED